jgi:sigma-E factor negative regulatory protein RseB
MRHGIRTRSARLGGALVLAWTLASGAVAGQPAATTDALGWIQRMNKAVVEGSFHGEFEQRDGGKRETWRILHRFKDGEMVERLVSTDGSGYEQKRKGTRWWQFQPEQRLIVTATRNRSYGFLQALNGLDDIAANYYDISEAGRARLLGREAQVIHIVPKDDLRYGYRFWLDVQSAMPLKQQRIARDGKVIKEITFTFLNAPLLPTEITDEQLKVAVDSRGYKGYNRDEFAPFYNPALKRGLVAVPSALPPGYRARRFGGAALEGKSAGPRARFIVSDGVSWAEVFLAPPGDNPMPDGGAPMGAFAGYGMTVEGVRVSVVGEMPLAAVKAIAQAFRPE